jgi:hypothetical protein
MLVQALAGRGPRDVDQRMARLLKQAAVHVPAAHTLTIIRRLPSVGVPDALWLGAGGLGLSAVGTARYQKRMFAALPQPVDRSAWLYLPHAFRDACFLLNLVLRRWTVPLK